MVKDKNSRQILTRSSALGSYVSNVPSPGVITPTPPAPLFTTFHSLLLTITMSSSSPTEKPSNGQPHLELKSHLSPSASNPEGSLPSPAVAPSPKPKSPTLNAATIIPIWIVLSSSVIIFNNYLYNTLGFRYPVFLVTWHLTFAVCDYPPYPPFQR